MQTKNDTMDAVLNILEQYRSWLDSGLISDLFPNWLLYLAMGGFLMGLTTAFCIWFRSARRIEALKARRDDLKGGDIDIDVIEEELPAPENVEEERAPEPSPVTLHPKEDNEVRVSRAIGDDFIIRTPFAKMPDDADDLTLLEGIDEDRASELRDAGIYKFSQLGNLDEEERRKFGFRFGWKDINWGSWAATAAAVGGAATLSKATSEESKNVASTVTLAENEVSSSEHGLAGGKLEEEPEMQPSTVPTENSIDTEELSQEKAIDSENREEESSKNLGLHGAAAAAVSLLETGHNEGGEVVEASVETQPVADDTHEEPEIAVRLDSVVAEAEAPPEPEFQLKTVFSEAPEDSDDLTNFEGIDAEKAAELNRAGIYKFSQLNELDDEQRENFARKFRFSDINWGTLGALTAGALGSGALLAADRTGEGETSLSTDIADPEVTMGDDLEFTTSAAGEVVDSAATSRDELAENEAELPEDADDFTLLEGIDKEKSDALHAAGIHKFSELEQLDEKHREEFSKKFNWPDLDWAKWGAIGAAGVAALPAENEETGEALSTETRKVKLPAAGADPGDVKADWTWGYTFNEGPDDADDLTLLDGISEEDAARFNAGGVYTIRQLEELPSEKREEVRSQFGWGDIDWNKWGTVGTVGASAVAATTTVATMKHDGGEEEANVWEAESTRLAAQATPIPSIDTTEKYGGLALSKEDFASQIAEDFAGESTEVHPRYGIVYPTQPDPIDDLAKVGGIGLATEKQLNKLGIYRFKQIANWNAGAIEGISTDLELGTRIRDDAWIEQAREFITVEPGEVHEPEPGKPENASYLQALEDFDGENVDINDNFGVIYTGRPKIQDDLKQIRGVGKVLEGELNSRGVYRFKQIAGWNPYNVWAFGRDLAFPGRITREKWVDQARELAKLEEPRGEAEKPAKSDPELVMVSPKPAETEAIPTKVVPALEQDPNDLHLDQPKGIFGIPAGSESSNGDTATQRVAFIMDVSRSLTPAQLRLSKTELSYSVQGLPEGSLYQVIFFSGPTWFAHQRMTEGGARGEDVVITDGEEKIKWRSGFGGFEFEGGNENLPVGSWREATAENIAATLDDIEAVGKSYGTTWHLPLTMAMNLEPAPEKIYFLTDGETARQDQVAEEMIDFAKQRGGITKVNTIALMVPGASVPLHRIASGTGGEYSLVIAGGKVLKDEDLREYLAEKDIELDD